MTTLTALYTARNNAVMAARTLATQPGMAAEWTLAVSAVRNIDEQIARMERQQQAARNVGKVRGALISNNGAN